MPDAALRSASVTLRRPWPFELRRLMPLLNLLLAALVVPVGGCSREQQDWHAAQSAATPEAYEAFIEQYPQSELLRQAQAQISQFAEERDWQRASAN